MNLTDLQVEVDTGGANPKSRHPLSKSLGAAEPAGKTLQRGSDPAMEPCRGVWWTHSCRGGVGVAHSLPIHPSAVTATS